jgi:hypothetical protein
MSHAIDAFMGPQGIKHFIIDSPIAGGRVKGIELFVLNLDIPLDLGILVVVPHSCDSGRALIH